MRLGLNIGYSGKRATAPVDLVRQAEAVGFDSVWVAEAYGSDAGAVAAWVLAQTTRIRVGTAIMQMPARTPANAAMTAMTLAQLSDNRFLVGLGASGPQVVEGWHGVPYGKPVTRMREYIQIMRRIMERQGPVEFDGEIYQLPYRGPGATGLGKPLKSILEATPGVPIYCASFTPGVRRARGAAWRARGLRGIVRWSRACYDRRNACRPCPTLPCHPRQRRRSRRTRSPGSPRRRR